jgi:hypothetical protein
MSSKRPHSFNLDLSKDALAGFCRQWKVLRLEFFGSALREDFGADSDIDFLVTFAPHADWSLFDLVDAERDLSRLVGRPVDLVEREPIEKCRNWIRRNAILGTAREIYVA